MVVALCCLPVLVRPAEIDAPAFDAARLKTGTFTYRDFQDGKPGSLSSCSVGRQGQYYRFSCDFPAYAQRWDTLATPAMTPVSTELSMVTKQGQRYVMTLRYAGHKVSGTAVSSASTDGRLPSAERTVAGDIMPDTVDQRIDWATVMASDVRSGQSFEFKVYDASTASSRVHCSVDDAGVMDAPGGRVRALRFTYTVYKSTGMEVYTVYASATYPRMMLREDLPGKLTSLLVKAEP